jgi:hypothetical protein
MLENVIRTTLVGLRLYPLRHRVGVKSKDYVDMSMQISRGIPLNEKCNLFLKDAMGSLLT